MSLTMYENPAEIHQELIKNFNDYLQQAEVLENFLYKTTTEIQSRLSKRFSKHDYKDALTLAEKWHLTDYFIMLYVSNPDKLVKVVESLQRRKVKENEDLLTLINEVIKEVWIGEEIGVKLVEDNNKTKAKLLGSTSLEAQKKRAYIRKIQQNSQHFWKENGILRQSVIIMITNNIEIFFNNLITVTVKRDPGIMLSSSNGEKLTGTIKFDELAKLNDIESAKESIITNYVENVMWGSVNEWVNFFDKNIKDKKSPQKFKTRLDLKMLNSVSDLFKVRNIIVHNGGKINETFINTVKENDFKKLPIGSSFQVTQEYLEKISVDVFKFLCDVLYNYWLMVNRKEAEKRAEFFHNTGYTLLTKEKYQEAQYVFNLILKHDVEEIKQSLRLMTQVNYSQTFKWLDDNDNAKSILKDFDFSIAPTDYLYSKALIEDNFKEAKKFLEQLVRENYNERDKIVYEFCTWPIAKKFIDSDYFEILLIENEINKDVLKPFTEEDDKVMHSESIEKSEKIEKLEKMKYNDYKQTKFRNLAIRSKRRNGQNDRKTNRNYKSNSRSRKHRKNN